MKRCGFSAALRALLSITAVLIFFRRFRSVRPRLDRSFTGGCGNLTGSLGRALACLAVFSLAGMLAYAQSDLGTIQGTVKDPSGASVPNAKVEVKNAAGVDRQVTTNEAGFYVVSNIPSGLYTVSVDAQGFKKFDSTNNKLDPSSTLAVDVALQV